ncbi:MAG: T9SS type A sorting domain-containing protein [Candidatus Delongbacteria bacterium]|nr:T9SS type A sorting domain-containing protein [Candidatus Delongbacteria bacterium]
MFGRVAMLLLILSAGIAGRNKPDLRHFNLPNQRHTRALHDKPGLMPGYQTTHSKTAIAPLKPTPPSFATGNRIRRFISNAFHAQNPLSKPSSGTIWFVKGPFIYVNSATWALMMLQTDTPLLGARVYYGYNVVDNTLYYDQVRDGVLDPEEDNRLVEFSMDALQTNQVVYFIIELTDYYGQTYYSYIYYFVSNTQEITTTYLLYEPSLISTSDSMAVIGFVSDLPAPGVIQLEYYQNQSKKYFLNTEKDYDYTHFVLIPDDYLDYLANPYTGHYLAPNTLFNYQPGLYFSIWGRTVMWDYKPFQLKTLPQPDADPPQITYGPVVFSYQDRAYVYLETDELSFSILYYYTTPDIAHSNPVGSTGSLYYGQYQLFELLNLNADQTYYYLIYIFDLRSSMAFYFSNGTHMLWSNIRIWPDLNLQSYTPSPAYTIQPGCRYQPPGNNNNSFSTSGTADETAPRVMTGPSIVDKNASQVILYLKSDEPSLITLFYATQPDMSDMVSKATSRYDINHWITLSSLKADQIYYYQIRLDDINGNEGWQPEPGKPLYVFKTLNTNTAPVATQITPTRITSLGNRVYLFEWDTDRPCNSSVELTENQTTWTTCCQQIPVSRHQVMVGNLNDHSTYYYRTRNAAFDNQLLTSALKSFNTSTASTPQPLTFTRTPVSTYSNNHAAIIEWSTSEDASSFIEYSINNQDWIVFNDDHKTTQHKMVLQNLKSNSLYQIKAYSVDYSGRQIGRTDLTFKTTSSQDQTPPAFPRSPIMKRVGLNTQFSWNAVTDPDLKGYALYAGPSTSSLKRIASGIVDTFFSDNSASSNQKYGVGAYDLEDNLSSLSPFVLVGVDESDSIPPSVSLIQHPNPFNESTTFSLTIEQSVRVKLIVYDLAGRSVIRLVDQIMAAGIHHTRWSGIDHDGRPVSSGLYLYRLECGDQIMIGKMIRIK